MAERTLRDKRIAFYGRFSSERQNEQSVDDQLRQCRREIARRGGKISDSLVFEDRAVSGAVRDRDGLRALMHEVKAGRVDVVVCEDVSRLTRDMGDASELYKRLDYHGVTLIALADGIDTTQDGARLAFNLKSLMSDHYRDELRHRTLRGMESRFLAGAPTGGLPYGFASEDSGGQKRIVIDEESAEIVRKIFALRVDGASFGSIAKYLNDRGVAPPRKSARGWVEHSVRSILLNETYAGMWTFKSRRWVRDPDSRKRVPQPREPGDVLRDQREHLRVVDQETWEQVAAIFEGNKRRGKGAGRKGSYLLSGLLRCGQCGSRMTINGGDKTNRYYRCAANKSRGTCDNRVSVREKVARRRILEALRSKLAAPAGLRHVRKRVAERIGELGRADRLELKRHREHLARTRKKIANLVEAVSLEGVSRYLTQALGDEETNERMALDAIARIEERQRAPVRLPSDDEIIARVFDLEGLLTADIKQLRRYPEMTRVCSREMTHPVC